MSVNAKNVNANAKNVNANTKNVNFHITSDDGVSVVVGCGPVGLMAVAAARHRGAGRVLAVDGVVVARFHPWRDDCLEFRDRNPYCARWTDGSWSSDYSRSGWCRMWWGCWMRWD